VAPRRRTAPRKEGSALLFQKENTITKNSESESGKGERFSRTKGLTEAGKEKNGKGKKQERKAQQRA